MPSTWRGHEIQNVNDEWVYSDNGQLVKDAWKLRECGYCKLPNRSDEHDACLGYLDGVANACCGHGNIEQAYVQFDDQTRLEGIEAIHMMNELKG